MNLEKNASRKTSNLNLNSVMQKYYELPKKLYRRVKKTKTNLELYFNEKIQTLILKRSIQHIYGLSKIDYDRNELVVTCSVRNGEIYINSFIQHYLKLGVKHIVFLDNGSTDQTIEIAKRYSNVTVLQTLCPYRKYETVMKKYLVNRFSKNRWNLFVDIDELFDYPFSNQLRLNCLLDYLNRNSYTAVVSQMLDMFSDKSLSELDDKSSDDMKSTYCYYDISQIRLSKYQWSQLNNEKIRMHFDGIRKTLFDTDNGLTKAALVFVNRRNKLFVDFHHVINANLADFTCVLLHYPFTSHFYGKVMEAVETDRYALSASHEYKKYWDEIQTNKNFTIKQNTSCKLDSINDLIEKGFLVISEKYTQWIHDVQDSSNR
ncbi:MAG: glycosyltransferase family 2 protein [Stenomitos frigidus ULC029]